MLLVVGLPTKVTTTDRTMILYVDALPKPPSRAFEQLNIFLYFSSCVGLCCMSVYSVNELVGTPCRKLVKQKRLQSQGEAEQRPPEGLSTQEKPGAGFRSRGLCVLVILGTYLCGYFWRRVITSCLSGRLSGADLQPKFYLWEPPKRYP